MTRLNVKLLAILAITFVVLTTGVVVVHAIQMRSNVSSLIKRADAAKTENPRAALRLYALYRSYKPDDLDIFADYALVAADVVKQPGANRRDFETAVQALEQVLTNRLLADREAELRRRLIELDLLAGRFAVAKEHLLKLKAKGQGDTNSDLQLAQCQISTGDYMGAVQLLESLIGYDPKTKSFNVAKAKAPKELKSYGALALVLRDKVTDSKMIDRVELADRVMDQLVTVNSDSAKAFLMQAQYLKDRQDRERAKQAVGRAIELAPDDADVLLQAIDLSFQSQDFAAAEKQIAKGIELYPKDDRFYQIWVIAAEVQKDPAEATNRLESGLEKLPSSARLLDLDFNRKIQQRDLAGAEVALKRLGNVKIDADIKSLGEAKLWFAQGKYAEASQRLETLRSKFTQRPDLLPQIDLMLSQCYIALGQPDVAGRSAERVPGLQAELMKVASLQQIGKTQEALAICEGIARVLEKENALLKIPQLASTLLQLRIADQSSKPKDNRDWSKVDDLLGRMRKENVLKEPNISLVEADVLNRKGEAERARQLLQNLRTQYPNDVSVVAVSAGLELQDKKLEAANQIINSASPEVRNSPALYGARIEAQFVAGGPLEEMKAGITKIAEEIEKLPKDDKIRLYPVLGTAYMRLNDRDLAMQAFKKAAELSPKEARIRWQMFELARQTGDVVALKELQTWFAENSGKDSSEAKFAEATVLTVNVREEIRKRQGDFATQLNLTESEKTDLLNARAILREVASARPDWVEEPRLSAEIDILEGKSDEAIAELRKVLERAQPTSQVVSQLLRLMHFRQRDADAQEILDQYGSLVTGEEMLKLKAIVNLANNRLDQVAEFPFDKNSKVWSDHLFHGQVMAALKRGADAETDFRKATELGPDEPQAWLALIGQLVNNNKREEALTAVQQAQIELPEDRRALVLAQGYELVNDQTQAEYYYKSALEAAPKDTAVLRVVASYYLRNNRKNDAQKYLNEILAATPVGVAQENIGWARRVIAQMLAGEGTYGQFRKGMEMLSSAGEKPTAEDLAMQVALLVERSDATSTREALRLLEQLKQIRLLTWRERLGMATLYERIGKWNLAREEMLSLISSKPDPSVYIVYVEMLLRHGDTEEAANLLPSVLRNADQKNNFQLATLWARTLAMQGRGQEAAKVLTDLLPAQRPLPQQQWAMLGTIAGSLEQIGQFDQAEKLWREYITYDPGQVLQLAAVLARQGKVDAALDLAEQYRRAFPRSSYFRSV